MLREIAKRGFERWCYISGSLPYLARAAGGVGVIIVLHEVRHDSETELHACVSASFLKWCIGWLRGGGWELVSMDEAERRALTPGAGRFGAITFDDGYRDTVQVAYPLLAAERTPFAVYVPSDALTRRLNAWWLGIRAVFRLHDRVAFDPMNRIFSCTDIKSKASAVRCAEEWVNEAPGRVAPLATFFKRYDVRLEQICEEYMLDIEELRVLAKDPLATIGGHTVTHPDLSTLPVAEAAREIAKNRRDLESLLQTPVRHFAYPYGRVPKGEGLALGAGYSTAATTQPTPVQPAHRTMLDRLPRIGVGPATTRARLAVQVSGIAAALARGRSFGRVDGA